MLTLSRWQRWLIVLVVLLGCLYAIPNAFYNRIEQGGAWPRFLPAQVVKLGLDLRGGAHLLAEVDLESVHQLRLDALWPNVRDALRAERATVGPIRRQNSTKGTLVVRLSTPAAATRAVQIVRTLAQPVLTTAVLNSLGGGTGGGSTRDLNVMAQGNTIHITLSDAAKQAMDGLTMRQSVEIIRRRVDESGTREPTIQRQGERRIVIQVPGIGSAADLKRIIGTTAQLGFYAVLRQHSGTAQTAQATPSQRVYTSRDDPNVVYTVAASPVLTGQDLTNAQPDFDQNGRPAVRFQFNSRGARLFGEYTAENVGLPFAIVLDEHVISAPVINEAIPGGSGIITGNFTVESANELAILLRVGALPADMTFLEERTVGPELGQDSIDAGTRAFVVAFVLVLVFMALSYGTFGIFANVALMLNAMMLIGVLSALGATLTLPGIAGIILTLGMAVDANVLIFERVREELRMKHTKQENTSAKAMQHISMRALGIGYERALSAIIDANITTFIAAAILFTLGAGPVRGFAVTLGLGVITSVFTAVYVTRLIVVLWLHYRRPNVITV